MPYPRLNSSLTKGETAFGWAYLLLHRFLSIPLVYLLAAVGIHLTTAWLNIAFFTLNFLVVVTVMHKYLASNLRSFGRRFGRCIATASAGFAVYWAVNMLVSIAISLYWPDFANANDVNLKEMSGECYWLFLVCTVLLVPITEETLFRGVLFGSIYPLSPATAYLFSALFFSVMHVLPYIGTDGFTLTTALISVVQYLPASVCLAWVYEMSGSVFASTLVHAAVNLIGVLAMR